MNQLGKNLLLALCILAAFLLIMGLKRKLAGDNAATLLSQPSENPKNTRVERAKTSPRPRVLQAKPVTSHDRAILSPTNSHFAETESSPAGGIPISAIPMPSPRPLDAPDLVPVSEPLPSSPTAGVDDELPEPVTSVESLPVPATVPLPEFVLTGAEDSFWTISERVYGSGVYYRALFRHNEAKVLRPDQLRPGIQVKTPPLDVLRELYPTDFPPESTP